MGKTIAGKAMMEELARRFPQLYVAPAEGVQEQHRAASTLGMVPEDATLSHFVGSDEDELREVDTPAGPVDVVFLKNRGDFETFLQIIGHKSQPVPIARTVGAITYRGLADWSKVEAAKLSFLATGGTDWPSEFSRLARTPGAFRSEIIIISEGPYSNVPAQDTGYSDEEWVKVSREIRLHHECAHVVCRRTLPDDILPVWDEITADVTGLLCATETYDVSLAARFLGVTQDGFKGGRLSEYLNEEQKANIDEVAREVFASLEGIGQLSQGVGSAGAFDFLLQLKRNPIIAF